MATAGLTRRLAMGGVAALATTSARGQGAAPALTQDIATFVGFGDHRVGTAGERRTARWLARLLFALGYGVETAGFPVMTLADPGGRLSAGSVSAAAFPQWKTPPEALNRPITGPLARLGEATGGAIAVLDRPAPLDAYWPKALQAAAVAAEKAGARALVIAFDEPTDGIFACNQDQMARLPLAVATLRPSDLARLAPLMGATATLVLRGRPQRARALDVIGHRPGVGEAIIVSTPLTGWFLCGAERGPGVALLLAFARRLAASRRPVWLVASGAHELGHLGMKQALRLGLPTPPDTGLWLHLGAGIAATALDDAHGGRKPRALTLNGTFAPLVKDILPEADWTRLPPRPNAPGEAGDIIAAGYDRIVGLAGLFPGFHTAGDNGAAVDPDRLMAIEAGLGRMLEVMSAA